MTKHWHLLREFFEHHDGSLPEIELHFEDAEKASAAFARLYECAKTDEALNRDINFWSAKEDRPLPWAGVDSGRMVASGDAEAFHLVLYGINRYGAEIPPIGVFFFGDCMALDWRMGPEWNPENVEAFVALLRDLCNMGARLEVSWLPDAEVKELFVRALAAD